MKLFKRNENRGFTMVELAIVLVILAILAAIAVPLYLQYVESARAGEAQEAIAAIMAAAKVQHAETGQWPTDMRQLHRLQLDRLTEERWRFIIIPGTHGIQSVQATSTGQMPGGAGKIVRFNAQEGKWNGYGFD
ncbi:MAG: prepilin-type N-terminal cleavage/methylation domain-containing protein [Candidatus Zixiibacteriota bacterium]|nr:MAG: prepilin-type N-terminal cleavage/methylation domain-containing protein [candidate division Zixibacteria bacterium]